MLELNDESSERRMNPFSRRIPRKVPLPLFRGDDWGFGTAFRLDDDGEVGTDDSDSDSGDDGVVILLMLLHVMDLVLVLALKGLVKADDEETHTKASAHVVIFIIYFLNYISCCKWVLHVLLYLHLIM